MKDRACYGKAPHFSRFLDGIRIEFPKKSAGPPVSAGLQLDIWIDEKGPLNYGMEINMGNLLYSF